VRDRVILEEERGRTRLNHIESTFRLVSLCGRRFDADGVERTADYDNAPDGRHAELCFDCYTVAMGGSISRARRENIPYLPDYGGGVEC
jgi:hypothetical protein